MVNTFVANPVYDTPAWLPQEFGAAKDVYQRVLLADDSGLQRWPLSGITFTPRGCPNVTAVATDPCVRINFVARENFDSEVTFTPFKIEERLVCSTMSGRTQDEIKAWAVAEVEASYSSRLAKQVQTGQYGPAATPTLVNQATGADDLTTSDVTPIGALAAVEQGLAQRLLGARGMIHMTVNMLTRLKSAAGVVLVNGEYLSPSGHRVVADAGYTEPVSGTSTIYGSGPVFYDTTGWQVKGDWESINYVHNDFEVFVQGYAIAWFEPCPVVKADASIATVPAFGT